MIRKYTAEEHLCDVCGKPADGTWNSTSYLNGEVSQECHCPLDLCQKHMAIWAWQMSDTAVERYDAPLSQNRINEIIAKLCAAVKKEEDKD